MVEYKCFRCGYIASQKIGLVRHLKRKNICLPKNDDVSIESMKKFYGFEMTPTCSKIAPNCSKIAPNDIAPNCSKLLQNCSALAPNCSILLQNSDCKATCEYCLKTFSRNSNLTKHLKTCKKKKENENEKDKKIEELIKNQEEMKEQMKEMVEKLLVNSGGNTITNNINNTNSNNTTNNTVNIHINNYGDENTKYITNDFILNLLNKPYSAIPELIKYTHFNDNHPENQNIKLTNKKEPYIKVLKNNKWELVDRKDTINDLIDQKHSILNTIDIKNNVDDNTYNRMELFNNKYLNDDKDLINKLYKDSELVLLNNS